MALTSLFSSTCFSPIPTITSPRITPSSHLFFPCITHNHSKREFSLPSVASFPYQPINYDYLEQEFSGHGVTFEGVGEKCIAKMELKNGSIVTMLLPSGLITSYKAPMWHGGKMELLHTAVSEGDYGDAVIQGGVSLNFKFENDEGQIPFSTTNWRLSNVKGNAEESIQVELTNKTSEGNIGLKYIVTLEEDSLSSELEISNSNSLPLQITGSILTHLTVSSPEATYALGLERSSYCSKPPFESEFVLRPPDTSQKEGFGILAIRKLFPWGAKKENDDETEESQKGCDDMIEETDNNKQLSEKISLFYTDAPRNFTIIDRGRRNSVSVGRNGFEEMYLSSPGSDVEIYSKYSFVSVGQVAVLKPVTLAPQHVWKGGQFIHNPNL